MAKYIFAALTLVSALFEWTNGHARLMDPPSRSSMWRFGYKTPANYDDNQLFCGGFNNQYSVNNGKCGICGDPYQGPRHNEAGGKYATGLIVRQYNQGQIISISVEITASHKGWFEFKICPNNNPKRAATQDCLDKNVLRLADRSGTKLYVHDITGFVKAKVRLPKDLTCSQCVLQWRWHTGNSWGVDPDGKGCVGCGDQEEFYGCADVEIKPSGTMASITTSAPEVATRQPSVLPPFQLIPNFIPQEGGATSDKGGSGSNQVQTTPVQGTINPGFIPLGNYNSNPVQENPVQSAKPTKCIAVSPGWKGLIVMDKWCEYNCLVVNKCRQSLCACS